MKSMWRVRTVMIAGIEHYQVYRLNDVCADDTVRIVRRSEVCGLHTQKPKILLRDLTRRTNDD